MASISALVPSENQSGIYIRDITEKKSVSIMVFQIEKQNDKSSAYPLASFGSQVSCSVAKFMSGRSILHSANLRFDVHSPMVNHLKWDNVGLAST